MTHLFLRQLTPGFNRVAERSNVGCNPLLDPRSRDGYRGASLGGRIAVRSDLDAAEGFRALAHELTHEKLDWQGEKDSKTVREVEADATAFVVCPHFGLQSDSADYLLLYDATPEVLLSGLETVRNTAAEIIGLVEDGCGAAMAIAEDV